MLAVASTMPPMAARSRAAPSNTSWFIEMAAGRRSGGTSLGWRTLAGLVDGPEARGDERDRVQREDAAAREAWPAGRGRGSSPPAPPGSRGGGGAGPPRRRRRRRRARNSMIGTSWTSDSTPSASRSLVRDVDLVGQDDRRDHPAGGADRLADPEQPEVAVEPERRGIGEQAADAAGLRGGGLPVTVPRRNRRAR